MNKLIIKISIILFILLAFTVNIYANEDNTEEKTKNLIKINVTEKIPGASCYEINDKGEKGLVKEGELQMYECSIEKGLGPIIKIMGSMIKYFTYIAILGAVLYIIINGITYSMGLKEDSKKRIIGTLIGLIILLLSGVILNMIAPWIYK